jgi:hypothetical protein
MPVRMVLSKLRFWKRAQTVSHREELHPVEPMATRPDASVLTQSGAGDYGLSVSMDRYRVAPISPSEVNTRSNKRRPRASAAIFSTSSNVRTA